MILKYQKLARLATHTNDWLRRIAGADLTKSLYENHITTGTGIDGKCIRLSTIEKYCGYMVMACFREAFKKKEKYSSYRFDFCGYDGTLWCEPQENGDMIAGFSKEYRNCGNGYYYLLINDDCVIGYDIDWYSHNLNSPYREAPMWTVWRLSMLTVDYLLYLDNFYNKYKKMQIFSFFLK